MGQITFADRCVMFVIVVVVIGTIFGGGMSFLNHGFSTNALIPIISGSVMLLIMMLFAVIIKIHRLRNPSSRNSNSPSLPQEDLPPNYRLTWRKEFLQMSPEHLRADIEKTLNQRPEGEIKRGVIPLVWTSDTEVGVHSFGSSTPLSTSSSSLSYSTSSSSSSSSSSFSSSSSSSQSNSENRRESIGPIRSASMIYDPDEGLPSYEDVQRW